MSPRVRTADDAVGMSVVVTGYNQTAVRVGVFYRPDGFSATSVGWPIGRFTFGAIGCSVIASGVASRRTRRTFAWADVVEAEGTRFGVRFRFDDPSQTVAIGTWRHAERLRLLDATRTYCPVGTVDDRIVDRASDDDATGATRRSLVRRAAIRVRRTLAGKTGTTKRRQPEQT